MRVLMLIFACLCAPLLVVGQTLPEFRTESAEQLYARERSAINTGVATMTTAEGAGATDRDFTSLLLAAFESAEAGKPVTLDWNLPLRGATPIQLETVLTRPDLSSKLTAALNGNSAVADSLKNGLSYTDDIATTVSWTNQNPQKDKTSFRLFENNFDANRSTLDKAVGDAHVEFANETDEKIKVEQIRAEKMKSDLRSPAAMSMLARGAAQADSAKPKWVVSAMYHHRAAIAGPREWKVKATYEFGFDSTSSKAFRDGMPSIASHVPKLSEAETMALYYLNATASTPANRNERAAVSLEAGETTANDIVIADASVNLHTPHAHAYAGSASIGQNVYNVASADHVGRLELALRYEDVTGDPSRSNRFVGSLTYTQKLNDKTSFPIALIYANKNQYLTDVNKRLNIHFGISYKLPDLSH